MMFGQKSCRLLTARSKLRNIIILIVTIVILAYVLSNTDIRSCMWSKVDLGNKWDLRKVSAKFFSRDEFHKSDSENCKIQNSEQYEATKSRNCSVLDFFAIVDPSSRTYDSDLVCDEFASKSDIFCRLYLRQIGLEHLEANVCAMKSLDRVPRIVYYVIFGVYQFRFLHYVSITAAKRFISPSAIYLIGDQHPVGHWWQKTLKDINGVRFLYRERPQNISGKATKNIHISDIIRLQAVYMNGGIYLDADMVVLKDLEPLLDFDNNLGIIDNVTGIGNAFVAAKRGSQFLKEWYTEYTNYKPDELRWNSLKVPYSLWLKNMSSVHLISDKLYRPNWFEPELLYKRSDYPWRNNYGVHVWSGARHKVPESPEEIAKANSTVAQMFRYILYGHHGIRKEDQA